MNPVKGFGGVFVKAKDPKFLARWYEDHLGIGFGTSLYFSFKWRDTEMPEEIAHTVFSFFHENTTYFYPGTNDLMINLRVHDLDELRIRLKNDGVFVVDKIEAYEYGRFGWAMDPAGNKIELWEPVDDGFGDRNKPMELTGKVTNLGGVFLKCPDPALMMKWYSKHFGMFFSYSAHSFSWRALEDRESDGATLLSFFPESTAYFRPSAKNFMLNFRVRDLEELYRELKSSEVNVIGEIEKYEYGSFGWCEDPEGNKIELWQPPA
jgi:predicted enzyme related to lactoylglutathione lyase